MATPQRIQLRRTKGWRKPDGVIVVSRPTRWSNPYHLTRDGVLDRDGQLHAMPRGDRRRWAVDRYREDLFAGSLPVTVDDVVAELAGRDLACWCPLGGPCHADVLLDIANS